MTDNKSRFSLALDVTASSNAMLTAILREIAEKVAARFVAEHYVEIASHLDPQAIANLSIAEGAAKIQETLSKKLPDKIMEVVRTETQVFQRGIFGGITRLK